MNTYQTKMKEKAVQLKDFNCDQWLAFSSVQQEEDVIRTRALFDAMNRANSICYSYLCKSNKLSEKFIEELMFITSELFDFEYYDQEHIDLVVDLIDHGFKSRDEQDEYLADLAKKIRMKNRDSGRTDPDPFITKILTAQSIVTDKLDWFYINKFQDLSPEFKEKHRKLIGSEGQKKSVVYFTRSKGRGAQVVTK